MYTLILKLSPLNIVHRVFVVVIAVTVWLRVGVTVFRVHCVYMSHISFCPAMSEKKILLQVQQETNDNHDKENKKEIN